MLDYDLMDVPTKSNENLMKYYSKSSTKPK